MLMKNWQFLPAVTQRRMVADLKLALTVSIPNDTPASQLERVERVLDLYEGLGMLLSTVPRGRPASDKDIHATLIRWRAEAANLNRHAGAASMPDEPDEEEEEEPEDPDETASLGDTRADQQCIEYNLLWKEARAELMKNPDVFAVSSVSLKLAEKFSGMALVAQEQVLRESRAALNHQHRRLRAVRGVMRERVVLAFGAWVDHLTAVHNEHKSKRIS
jgi:hypothetical protein